MKSMQLCSCWLRCCQFVGAPSKALPQQRKRPVELHGPLSFSVALPCPCLPSPPCQVAIKKVLQDKRFKNRELQIIRMMSHPNIVQLKHCFYTTTEKDEVRLKRELQALVTCCMFQQCSCAPGRVAPCNSGAADQAGVEHSRALAGSLSTDRSSALPVLFSVNAGCSLLFRRCT